MLALNMDRRAAILAHLPIFSKLEPRSMEAVATLARDVAVSAGTVLMREGEPAESFYVIVTGTVHVQRAGRFLRSMSDGGFLGELREVRVVARLSSVCGEECLPHGVAAFESGQQRELDRRDFKSSDEEVATSYHEQRRPCFGKGRIGVVPRGGDVLVDRESQRQQSHTVVQHESRGNELFGSHADQIRRLDRARHGVTIVNGHWLGAGAVEDFAVSAFESCEVNEEVGEVEL